MRLLRRALRVLAQDRFGCSTRRSKGTCDNSVTINRRQIEARVLAALRTSMLTPELVTHFIKTYDAEIARRQKEAGATQTGCKPSSPLFSAAWRASCARLRTAPGVTA